MVRMIYPLCVINGDSVIEIIMRSERTSSLDLEMIGYIKGT